MSAMDTNSLKQQAAETAAEWVESGMVVGLGSGSTAIFATRRIAQRIDHGDLRDILGVPTSLATEAAARELGIPLTTLSAHPRVDMTIDGADEVDPELNVIKGGGGALLCEKIVAQVSARLVIVVDDSKLSPRLGTRFYVPVETVPFSWESQAAFLEGLGAQATLRMDEGQPYQTDQGNMILDCRFGPIEDAAALARALEARAGIVEHGLFIGMASDVVVAGLDGVRHSASVNPAFKGATLWVARLLAHRMTERPSLGKRGQSAQRLPELFFHNPSCIADIASRPQSAVVRILGEPGQ